MYYKLTFTNITYYLLRNPSNIHMPADALNRLQPGGNRGVTMG